MLHFRDDYARADVAKRREFERLHNGAPIHPMSFDDKAGLSIWIIAGIVSLTCLVVGWLGMTGRI